MVWGGADAVAPPPKDYAEGFWTKGLGSWISVGVVGEEIQRYEGFAVWK